MTLKNEERAKTLELWQQRWTSTPKAAWTKRLFPDLRRWYHSDVEPTFQLSESLTGHGSFQSYLAKMKRANSPACVYCIHPQDTAEHTIFECNRWDNLRLKLGQFLGGRNPSPDDVADLLCVPIIPQELDEDSRKRLTAAALRARAVTISMFVEIMRVKEEDERQLQKLNRLGRV